MEAAKSRCYYLWREVLDCRYTSHLETADTLAQANLRMVCIKTNLNTKLQSYAQHETTELTWRGKNLSPGMLSFQFLSFYPRYDVDILRFHERIVSVPMSMKPSEGLETFFVPPFEGEPAGRFRKDALDMSSKDHGMS